MDQEGETSLQGCMNLISLSCQQRAKSDEHVKE